MKKDKTIMTNKYKIALSCGRGMGIIENKVKSWADIVKKLTHHVEVAQKENAGFFVGGAFSDDVRVDEDLLCRSLLTLDIDEYQGGDIDDLSFDLELSGLGAFVAYSTHRHVNNIPRVRLVLPLSREVSSDEYRVISQAFCKTLTLFKFDPCSFKPNQFMFYPCCPVGGDRWVMVGDGDAVNVDLFLTDKDDVFDVDDESDDDDFTRDLPLNMSDDEVKGLLFAYQAEGLEYDDWLKVGQALHHQYLGSDVGFDLWVSWSALSSKHDA